MLWMAFRTFYKNELFAIELRKSSMTNAKGFYVMIRLILLIFLTLACSETDVPSRQKVDSEINLENIADYHYLALGDSYTVGESVTYENSFPVQLEQVIETDIDATVDTEIIAVTGWRTDDLLDGLNNGTERSRYDFVTLLIGVNNQYQGREFDQYENEFVELLDKAIALANGDTQRVFVISIPDYAYTPFARNSDRDSISSEIDSYNAFAKETASKQDVTFVNITDITRKGLDEPELVAEDGLHPSGEAYKRFVERIAPSVISKLKD